MKDILVIHDQKGMWKVNYHKMKQNDQYGYLAVIPIVI
jgi:hypothetical protein